ncbi:sialin-like [Panulirus ornatus]|uniref:sialin-like n=1 Tax=Panulirus ornatus TaxID=150431 RepID=UPI003A8784AC
MMSGTGREAQHQDAVDPPPSVDDADEGTPLLRKSAGGEGGRWWSPRYTTAVLASLGVTIMYCQRVNLSVAIVPMAGTSTTANASDLCPNTDHFNTSSSSPHSGEFDWDAKTQGMVLGSFFWGYATTNIVGGRASEYLGGRTVFGMGIIASSLFSLISPLCAKSRVGIFLACRILTGMAQGVTFPAVTTLLASWYLPLERTKFTTVVFSGVQFGTMIGMTCTAWLASSTFLGGWPASFYVFGVTGLAWCFAWFMWVYDHPEDHPNISDAELRTLRRQQDGIVRRPKVVAFPWRDIVTSQHFWSVVAASLGHNYALYTLLTELPTYLNVVQHLDLSKNGFLSSLPYLLMWIWSLCWAALMHRLTTTGRLTILSVRRISMATGLYGVMLSLVAMVFVQCNTAVVVLLLCLAGMLCGSVTSGYLCSFQDLAPNLAGTLLGISNTAGSLTGIISPTITGVITQDNETLLAWQTVFLLNAGVALVSCTLYLCFITADVQPWNDFQRKGVVEVVDDPDYISHLSAADDDP